MALQGNLRDFSATEILQLVGTQIREQGVHLQNDRKFGLFAHSKYLYSPETKSSPAEVCHKSHNFAAPLNIFEAL